MALGSIVLALVTGTIVLASWGSPRSLDVSPRACGEPPDVRNAPGDVTITRLRTEYLTNPLGIDVRRPRLSWVLESTRNGLAQTAFQVQVASSQDALDTGAPDVWDSGRIASSGSVNVEYDGPALRSATRYHWRVRVWDADGARSPWSGRSWWETGLLETDEWTARWISPGDHGPGGSYLQQEFRLPARPVRARAYISARGSYERGPDSEGFCCEQAFSLARGISEVTANGRRVGTAVLDPPPVDTRARTLYRTEDVTSLVRKGRNVVGVMIGEDSDVLVQVDVDLADGTSVRVGTGPAWRSAPAPVKRAHRYHGETYDARAERAGWDLPGFDARGWRPASLADGTRGTLSAAMLPPMRVVATHRPAEIRQVGKGIWQLDFGTNVTGWTRLRVDAPPGTEIGLKHGEVLDSEGRIDNGTLKADGQRLDNKRIGAQQTNRYISAGNGPSVWEPRFVYAGFRYVEVSGLPEAPGPTTVEAREVHNDLRPVGHFVSSDPMLNRLHAASVQTQRNGMHGIPEDTPTREKRGWLADAHVAAPAVMTNLDAAAFYSKFVRDIRDAQQDSGLVPDIVPVEPTPVWQGRSDPAWGVATILLPYHVYRHEGDIRILHEHYAAMSAWFRHMRTTTTGLIVDSPSQAWGNDWVAIEETPGRMYRTGYYFLAANLMSEIAATLGRGQDAASYAALAGDIREAFNATFLDAETSSYGDSQFAQAFPLVLGIVPADDVPAVRQHLVRDVVTEHDGHFTGGLPGIASIPDALAAADRADVVLDVLRRRDFPSWGYMLDHGPGTIWERWDGSGSRNHHMFTSIDQWLYRYVAGIDQAEDSAGFRELVFAPRVTDRLESAGATLETPYGEAVSRWCHIDERLVYDVTVPPNTTAKVHVPATSPAHVRVRTSDHGTLATADVSGAVDFRGMVEGSAVYHVRSGRYQFVSRP
ncbi:family 78 glycoside hydrolase catalytic domain [Actinopolymorpha sp. B9G3]|uniref:family 78 glycoside hydrolase catalytic domain n=1 Tax=Actinopolymorpha sp. B9G3 TaxID=3158970 RepID=UPI0032D95A0D